MKHFRKTSFCLVSPLRPGDKVLEILAADSSTGTLFCLSAAGEVVWKTKLHNSTDSSPSVADLDGDGAMEIVVGVMAMADRHGRVLVLDAATQKEKWIAKVPGHVQSEPVLVDLNGDHVMDVLVTTWRGDKCVRALYGRDGHELWKYAMQGDMYHGISVVETADGVRLIAASIAGDVTMLDGNGQLVWSKQPGGYLFAPTTLADVDGDGTLEIAVASGRMHLFDLAVNELWKTESIGKGSDQWPMFRGNLKRTDATPSVLRHRATDPK